MSDQNLDAYNLSIQNLGGLIHEDVMNKIWDISQIPLPFTDKVGSGSHDNQYFEWTMDKLQDPVTNTQRVDGSGGRPNESKLGRRVGNQSEIRTKTLEVSTRANRVDTIGFAKAMAYQVTQRQKELRRDVEATALSNNASVIGTDTVAGVTAGLSAWLVADTDVDGNAVTGLKNVSRGATGADGGWDDTATDKLVAASTPGTTRAISESGVRDVVQAIYEKGGEPSVMMTTPAVKRKFGEYLFSETAKVATMYSDKSDGATDGRSAQGNVDVFITDYGVLKLVPNRLQGNTATDNATAFILDTSLIEMSYLQGYQTAPLATDGLYERREVSVDWGLCVKNWDGLGSFADIDPSLAATA